MWGLWLCGVGLVTFLWVFNFHAGYAAVKFDDVCILDAVACAHGFACVRVGIVEVGGVHKEGVRLGGEFDAGDGVVGAVDFVNISIDAEGLPCMFGFDCLPRTAVCWHRP